ncbi:MAG: hypothetical protein ACI9BH_000152, partial [Paracoccaceae bacterium]
NSDGVLRCIQPERMDTRMIKERSFTGQFKAAVALEALRGDKTVQEIAAKRQIHLLPAGHCTAMSREAVSPSKCRGMICCPHSSHSSSPLLHNMLSKGRNQTVTGPLQVIDGRGRYLLSHRFVNKRLPSNGQHIH